MFHKSELSHFGDNFPQDSAGYVPIHGDEWRQMKFDHADMDPDEEGISAEEKARRIEYLDNVWWPKVLEDVAKSHQTLTDQHGESFMEHWQRVVNKHPDVPHGFGVE